MTGSFERISAGLPLFDRDLSWLSFNERVLMEAEKEEMPLLERMKFLAIYSSNLDEFYRVRITSILAANDFKNSDRQLAQIKAVIHGHLQRFGKVLTQSIIPGLKNQDIEFLYNEEIPAFLNDPASDFFFTRLAGLLHITRLDSGSISPFNPENNKIYFAVAAGNHDKVYLVNIPSDTVSRFHCLNHADKIYILMIDDIIRTYLPVILGESITGELYAFKITRDAELNLEGEVPGNVIRHLEKLLARRDFGLVNRFLYDPSIPDQLLNKLTGLLQLKEATKIAGGRYHNLKDLFSFPLTGEHFSYPNQPPENKNLLGNGSVFSLIDQGDVMLHTPYESYQLILRFFNEAALDPAVESIYLTVYRIAVESFVAQALMSAAQNGKKVTVIVELKARFDEANNIRWAKKMKAAGVRIVYSQVELKVHAKIALVKRRVRKKIHRYGLFSTGNFNENTARLYTDHMLLTSHRDMLDESNTLFKLLINKSKAMKPVREFTHLIVAPFNIRKKFFELIDQEIEYARNGRPAGITIKINNLEEESLISKLYEASAAGVKIDLIVRSICRLVPGVKDISENITVRKIIDRYLEHGRIFIFQHGGNPLIYCGSADWMNRNIYHRVEVCFPIYDAEIRTTITRIINLQLEDNVQAVLINDMMQNVPIPPATKHIRSQNEIYGLLSRGNSPDSR
jgi:polyphosphate kinase